MATVLAGVVAFSLSGANAAHAGDAHVSSPGAFEMVCIYSSYCALNYESSSDNPVYDGNHVDWMLNAIYYGNMWIDKAKNGPKAHGYDGLGSVKAFGMWNGGTIYDYVSDTDKGIKNDSYWSCWNNHYYFWAPNPPDYAGPIPYWGNLVFGSSHIDNYEGGGTNHDPLSCNGQTTWFGQSENPEFDMYNLLMDPSSPVRIYYCDGSGCPISTRNYLTTHNTQYNTETVDGNSHIWHNNGLATVQYYP